ncbi:hypothetical protein T492DRAFT_944481 [Pavlovales sp. CCMP2436]|nr:hypothetical protein T492DRAFT_944481 [Pavlovales sp. CCMP2436]
MAVEAPRLTRWFEFKDPELESQYRHKEVRHLLERRTAIIGLSVSALSMAGAVLNLTLPEAEHDHSVHGATYHFQYIVMCAVYAAGWISYAAYARAACRNSWATSLTEQVFLIVFVLVSVPVLLAKQKLRPMVDTLTGDRPDEVPVAIVLHHLLAVVFTAVYAPIRTRVCVAIAGVGTGAFMLNFAFWNSDWEFSTVFALVRLEMGIVLVVLALAMIFVNSHMNCTNRTKYHFYRAVGKVHESLVEQRLSTAKAKKDGRSRLIRTVMHDLRSPLLSVANSAAVLAEMDVTTRLDDAIVTNCHAAIATCSELMQNIVSDMLDFERIDSGKMVLVPAAMRISQLTQAAAHTFGGLAKSKGVTLLIEPLAADLETTLFIGDVHRLQQCVNNGVSNALKFSKAGGLVAIRAFLHAESIVLEVQDQGAGLDAEELSVLVKGEAFTQVGRGQLQGSGGAGLGLTIVREIVRLYEGSRMTLDSAGLGRGALFKLELVLPKAGPDTREEQLLLPAAHAFSEFLLKEHQVSAICATANKSTASSHLVSTKSPCPIISRLRAQRWPHQSPHRPPSRRRSRKPTGLNLLADHDGASLLHPPYPRDFNSHLPHALRVCPLFPLCSWPPGFRLLHVEDDVLLRKSFELRVLRKLQVPFDVAENGAEAVRLILYENRAYSVILMDNQMPVLTGEMATRQLRAGGFTGTIIGMTGDPLGTSTRRVAELVASFALGEDYGEPRLSNSGGPLMLEL